MISSLGKDPEHEAVLDFSSSHAPYYLAVFGPETKKVESVEALSGKTISVTRGTIEDMELSAVAPKGTIIKCFEDGNATVAAYLSGQIELIASGSVVMASCLASNFQPPWVRDR